MDEHGDEQPPGGAGALENQGGQEQGQGDLQGGQQLDGHEELQLDPTAEGNQPDQTGATGTRPKNKSKKHTLLEREPPPFSVSKLLSQKEFFHLAASRHYSATNVERVVAWFHNNIYVSAGDRSGEAQFSTKCLSKSRNELLQISLIFFFWYGAIIQISILKT